MRLPAPGSQASARWRIGSATASAASTQIVDGAGQRIADSLGDRARRHRPHERGCRKPDLPAPSMSGADRIDERLGTMDRASTSA